MKAVRCAIYTRKSSEEGLEQDFNSLDAQREACAAYVKSQASEGWQLLPEFYDDGGISGGTLERPALQRLLGDVRAGRIDTIVVYKVDRLTRSLMDFAKLVETLDNAGTSFVSVTQSFNTTTSMGRLTLNMLLSFAQFEREVTAERIRDKIAASKAKGMWMGGNVPLGYAPEGRSLKIVEEHAALIRDIYARYRQLGDSGKVADFLKREGIGAPQRFFRNGKSFGGCALSRGNIAAILKNPVYAGDIAHKEQIFAGNHPAIIDREQWDAAQRQRKDNTKNQRSGPRPHHSLLAGLLADENGKPLCPSHTTKGSHRYRYYISQPDDALHPSVKQPLNRIPAREIEQVVRQEVGGLLADPLQLFAQGRIRLVPSQLTALEARGKELAAMLTIGGIEIVRLAVTGVVVHPERLTVKLSLAGLGKLFSLPDVSSGTFDHTIPVTIRRSGRVARFVDQNGAPLTSHGSQRSLAGLLSTARVWWGELSRGEVDVATLARAENVCPSWMTRVVRLAFLAPEVVDAILAGQVRADLDGGELLATGSVDLLWDRQKHQFLNAQLA